MLKICSQGHQYQKTSDCPTCPKCEQARKPKNGLLSQVAAPARRALEQRKINTVHDLACFTEKDILELHGVGPNTIPKLRVALEEAGLSFKEA